MKRIRFDKDSYDYFVEDFGLINLKTKKVAVCEIGRKGFLSYDGTFKLINLFEGKICNYQDERVLLIDPNDDKKGFEIFEAIVMNNVDDFVAEILDMGDVKEDKVDPKIYELRGKVDLFITSTEDAF